MSESFRLKQFSIQQSQSPLKLGTDAMLLGSWSSVDGHRQVLDVGTGTGILALMVAQRNPDCQITAIDVNEAAAREARLNVADSPFSDRISVQHTSLQEFVEQGSASLFDLIICNPPYFDAGIQAPDAGRAQARHTVYLSFEALLEGSQALLSGAGQMSLILPSDQGEVFLGLARDFGLFPMRIHWVRSKPNKLPNRVLLELVRSPVELEESELCIHAAEGPAYSQEFIRLTKDFYLGM